MILELSRAVERAKKPSRDLDAKISLLLGKGANYRTRTNEWEEDGGFTIPRYTASAEAALQFVPEGWRVDNWKESQNGEFWALLRPREYQNGPFFVTASGKSFALALIASALLARQEQSLERA